MLCTSDMMVLCLQFQEKKISRILKTNPIFILLSPHPFFFSRGELADADRQKEVEYDG